VDFPVGQATQRVDFDCTYLAYLEHSKHEPVEVVYDPANPQNAQLGGNLNSHSSWVVIYASALAIFVGLLLTFATASGLRTPPDQTDPGIEDMGD
jgi:hypothetical protein